MTTRDSLIFFKGYRVSSSSELIKTLSSSSNTKVACADRVSSHDPKGTHDAFTRDFVRGYEDHR